VVADFGNPGFFPKINYCTYHIHSYKDSDGRSAKTYPTNSCNY
jgi:hypothetical protein